MKAWLRKNWPTLIGIVVAMILVFGVVESCVNEINYKSQIRKLNQSIAEKEKRVKESETREDKLKEDNLKKDDEIAEKNDLLREKDTEISVIRGERDEWRGKVENMPPTQIVIETRVQLACDEVYERPDGVLFSLACARTNLQILGDFSLTTDECEKLNEKVKEMAAKDLLKDAKIENLEKMYSERGVQLTNERAAKEGWKGKFDLSEGRRKKARKKGRKEGAIIGGILGGLIGFFLGK